MNEPTIDRKTPPAGRPGLIAEFWDAVAPRTAAMVLGVLLIQLLFIASYVGAFGKPTHTPCRSISLPPRKSPRRSSRR